MGENEFVVEEIIFRAPCDLHNEVDEDGYRCTPFDEVVIRYRFKKPDQTVQEVLKQHGNYNVKTMQPPIQMNAPLTARTW